MRKLKHAAILAGVLLLIISPTLAPSAEASLVQIFDRASLTGGTVFWGPSYNPGDPVTVAGITCTPSTPSGSNLNVRIEGTSMPYWTGNFSPGDYVLNTFDTDDNETAAPPIRLDFSYGVYGVGTQMQTGSTGTFTARVEAFSAGGSSLGHLDVVGNSTQSNDGSAVFLGFLTSLPVGYVEFSWLVGSDDPYGLAINQLSLNSQSQVPIPSGVVLLGLPLLRILAVHRRRRC